MKKTHAQIAAELFNSGYNCSQSVFVAYCDVMDIDRDTALKLSSSFGGGMGRMREVCGACSAMFMVAGYLYGYTDGADRRAKAKHYKLIQSMAESFKSKYGTIICKNLLELDPNDKETYVPAERNDQYYSTRPCVRFVCEACDILDKIIESYQTNTSDSENCD